jgi:hypothetical protein
MGVGQLEATWKGRILRSRILVEEPMIEYNYDVQKQFGVLMDQLVQLNIKQRENYSGLADGFSHLDWARDWCTIHCDMGRRSGKTSWVKHTAKKGDLIVTPIWDLAERQYPDWLDNRKGNKDHPTVTTARCLKTDSKGKEFNTIFVEEPYLVFHDMSVEEFYQLLATRKDQTFIMLGSQR